MGHLTKNSCRDFIDTDVTSGIVLDKKKDATNQFPHDAENCHHLILATLAADGDKLEIHYSLDGTTWFFVAAETEEMPESGEDGADTFHVSYDTGMIAGVNGVAPKYVKLITNNAANAASANMPFLQVRTYGSVVKPPVVAS